MKKKPDKKEWSTTEELIKSDSQRKIIKHGKTDIEVKMPEGLLDLENKPKDIIARIKAKKVKREVGIEILKTWYNGQLQVAETYIIEKIHTTKEELGRQAQQFILDLDRRHLEFLAAIGLKNVSLRHETLINLGEQTAKALADLEEKREGGAWPSTLINETIRGVISVHRKFFEKINKDDFSSKK